MSYLANAFRFLAEETEGGNKTTSMILLIVVLVVVFAVIFIIPMFNNKKQQKKYKNMVDTIKVGDTVKTIGGIVGEVVAINTVSPTQKEFVLTTGTEDAPTTMVFDINALYQVVDKNTHEPVPPVPADPEPKKEKKGKKSDKDASAPVETTAEEPAPETDRAAELEASAMMPVDNESAEDKKEDKKD